MTERKLARVVTLDDVITHPNADSLDLAVVGGWQCVVKRGEYKKGDQAIYVEVDAACPLDRQEFAFLEGKNNVTLDNKRYARIKTIKLRKEISQGLIIPLERRAMNDEDFTEELGIVKYEKPEERERNAVGVVVKDGVKKLGFPNFIPKTDQERVQNKSVAYRLAVESGERFEKSFKLDGSSLTAWAKGGVTGVASRNVGFRMEDEKIGLFEAVKNFFKRKGWVRVLKKDDNQFTQAANELDLPEKLKQISEDLGFDIALQGELVGPSIQKNFEGVDRNMFFVYDIFNITEQKYLLPADRRIICQRYDIPHVPVHSVGPLPADMQDAIKDADGPSGLNGKYREGFVYKSVDRDFSFKVISNSYLMKEE